MHATMGNQQRDNQQGDSQQSAFDFDLHGIVGIRLLHANAQDRAAVARQLGPIQMPLQRTPDIIIRFVDRLPLASPLHYLGVNEAAFTQDAFFVLRGKHKAQVMVQIPFATIGQPCEILCEHGAPAVPLLIPILNLTALNKGVLPLHAAAFRYNGLGVLVTGWSKGGKTESLLAFAANGAEYIGDEWVYISHDGQHMSGIPEPVRVWDWHLETLPHYRTRLKSSERTRLRTLKFMINALEQVDGKGAGRQVAPLKLMQRMTPLLKQQLHVNLAPQKLFGQKIHSGVSQLDKLFFVGSHAASAVTVRPVDPQVIAQRMVFSLQEERMDLQSYYHMFRFAFPAERNELIEAAEERQRALLLQLLAGKEAYELYHPYPVALPRLFEAMSPLLAA
ncbi:MAG: hypothetical protein KF832_07795 [Caldilineaceae bacterium]|nr:hypothetical protein [Caldilineaceae bacterium]